MSAELLASASDICNRIYQAGQFDHFRDRDWYDQVSSQIALIAGNSPVLYIDHNINGPENDNSTAMIVAITRDNFIIADLSFTPGSDSNGQLVGTRAIGRKDIASLTVGRVTNAIDYHGDDWPRNLTVSLKIGGLELKLPFRSYVRHTSTELAEVVPSLARDLNR